MLAATMFKQSQVLAIMLVIVTRAIHSLPLSRQAESHNKGRQAGSNRLIRSLQDSKNEVQPSVSDHRSTESNTEPNYVDYSEIVDGESSTGGQQSRVEKEVKQEQLKSIKAAFYEDYEFDITDTDQTDNDDDILRKYYGPLARRAAFDDYEAFADIMQLTDTDSFGDSSLSRQSQYGYLGDHSSDGMPFDADDAEYSEFENEW